MSELTRIVGHLVGVTIGWCQEEKYFSFDVTSSVSKTCSSVIREAPSYRPKSPRREVRI